MNRKLLNLLLFILLIGCGQTKKSIENTNSKVLFEEPKSIEEQINPNIQIKLTNLLKDNTFIENKSNNNGNINFKSEFEKKKSYKFSKIKQFNSLTTEMIFTKNNDIIYFDKKGTIFRINENFENIWKRNHYTKKEKKLNPILYFNYLDENLLVADTLSNIYSLNISTGDLIWKKESVSPFHSNLVAQNDKFIVVDFDNVIRCFSIKNGDELWNFKTENTFIKSQKKLSIIIKDNLVVSLNSLGDVTALNAEDGSLIWQTPTQSNQIYLNAFSLRNSDLVIDNDTLYFSNNKNDFFSIDIRSGIIKWKQNINSSLRPTILEDYIFTISEKGFLFVVEKNSGNILRVTDIFSDFKKREKVIPIGFIIAQNVIYLSTSVGKIIKISIFDSEIERIIELNNDKISRPYINNKNIYLIKNNAIIKSN